MDTEVVEVKVDLSGLKKELKELGKDEAEDVLKGIVNILAKVPMLLVSKYKFMVYIVPIVPMIKDMLLKAIDKIDGKEG